MTHLRNKLNYSVFTDCTGSTAVRKAGKTVTSRGGMSIFTDT